jgi:hypothetical protein
VKSKRQRVTTSFIWRYGWRVYKPEDGLEYWICKLCHTGPKKPTNPKCFAYICGRSTSSPIEHPKHRHRLDKDGLIRERSQPLTDAMFEKLATEWHYQA